jgi:hypothetical protein
MRTRMRSLIAAGGAAVLLLVSASTAPAALAASHIVHAGRGGVFVLTAAGPASAASIAAGVAVSLAAIAVVAFIALGLGRQKRAQLAPVAVSDGSREARSTAQTEDRDRKAA